MHNNLKLPPEDEFEPEGRRRQSVRIGYVPRRMMSFQRKLSRCNARKHRFMPTTLGDNMWEGAHRSLHFLLSRLAVFLEQAVHRMPHWSPRLVAVAYFDRILLSACMETLSSRGCQRWHKLRIGCRKANRQRVPGSWNPLTSPRHAGPR